MTMSFRLRVFGIAVGIVLAVLAAVTAVGWSSVLRLEVERLDARLCTEARRFAHEPLDERERPRIEEDLLGKLHLNTTQQLLLRVEPAAGPLGQPTPGTEGAAASPRTPALDLERLAWTTTKRDPTAERQIGRAHV
jgi:hypothetical protein